jgi:hypothetical protein
MPAARNREGQGPSLEVSVVVHAVRPVKLRHKHRRLDEPRTGRRPRPSSIPPPLPCAAPTCIASTNALLLLLLPPGVQLRAPSASAVWWSMARPPTARLGRSPNTPDPRSSAGSTTSIASTPMTMRFIVRSGGWGVAAGSKAR